MAPKRRKSRKSSSRSSRKKSRKRHSPKGRGRFGSVVVVDGNTTVERMTMKTFVDIMRQMAIQSIEYIGQENAKQMYNNVIEWTSELEKMYLELEDLIAKEGIMNLEIGDEEEMNLLDVEIELQQAEIRTLYNKIKTVGLHLYGLIKKKTHSRKMFQRWMTEKDNLMKPPALRDVNTMGLNEIIGERRLRRPPPTYNV